MKRYDLLRSGLSNAILPIACTLLLAAGCKGRLIPERTEAFKKSVPGPVVFQPEVPAQFPGGNRALMQYLLQNLKYPQAAAQKELIGNNIVRFTIDAKGNVRDAEIMSGMPGCPECDEEAIRAVRAMPRWSPGRQDDKPVDSKLSIPLYFIPQ